MSISFLVFFIRQKLILVQGNNTLIKFSGSVGYHKLLSANSGDIRGGLPNLFGFPSNQFNTSRIRFNHCAVLARIIFSDHLALNYNDLNLWLFGIHE